MAVGRAYKRVRFSSHYHPVARHRLLVLGRVVPYLSASHVLKTTSGQIPCRREACKGFGEICNPTVADQLFVFS